MGQNPTEADVVKFTSQASGGNSKDKDNARISFDEFLPILAAIRFDGWNHKTRFTQLRCALRD